MHRILGTTDFTKIAVNAVLRICSYRTILFIIPTDNVKPTSLVARFTADAIAVKFDDIHLVLLSTIGSNNRH
jgi:hypothetical protein